MARKRANGEGSVFERGDGKIVATFVYHDPITGERKRSTFYGKTKAEARAKMTAARQRVERGAPAKDAKVSLGAFTERWISTTLDVSDRKETTKEAYASLARNHIVGGVLGDRPLDRLKATDVERLIKSLRDRGLSDSTVRQTYTVLRAVLDTAVRDGLVARNVAATIKRPKVEAREARYLSRTEIRQLFQAAQGYRNSSLITLLAFTGLRRGEALALKWEDVDLKAGTLRVRGTLARINRGLVVTEPKTNRSKRSVSLGPAVVEDLRAHRQEQAEEQLRAGPAWQGEGYVFTNEVGGPVDPRNALRSLSAAAKRAGLEDVNLHTLRHSAATAMLTGGVPLPAVSKMLGHSSIAITGDVYAHVTPEVERGAAETLSRAFAE